MHTQDGKNLRKPIKTSPTPPNTTTHCMLPMHALNAKHLQTQHEQLENLTKRLTTSPHSANAYAGWKKPQKTYKYLTTRCSPDLTLHAANACAECKTPANTARTTREPDQTPHNITTQCQCIRRMEKTSENL